MDKNNSYQNNMSSETSSSVEPSCEINVEPKVVVFESNLRCNVSLPMGCKIIKDGACADFVVDHISAAINCDGKCDICEKECTMDDIREFTMGLFAVKDICSLDEAAERLVDFYSGSYSKMDEENLELSVSQVYCRGCNIGKAIYEKAEKTLDEDYKRNVENYEKESISEFIGGSVEDFIESVEREILNDDSDAL